MAKQVWQERGTAVPLLGCALWKSNKKGVLVHAS
jgi:hypothetical protein